MRQAASPFDFPGDDRGVLCLHGLTGTPHDLRHLGARLGERGFTVVGPMLPGHGGTIADLAATSWRDWAAGAADALTRLRARCRAVAVVGQSMGGLCALHLAAAARDGELAAVASLAAPLWLEGLAARAARWVAPGGWLHGRIRALPKLGGPDVGVRRERKDSPGLPAMPARSVVEVSEMMKVVDEELPRVRAPLLVLHGRRDHTAPVGSAARIASRAGAARTRILLDSRHVLSLDVERDVVVAEVGDFFARHLGAARG
jgi:carboxylesterase